MSIFKKIGGFLKKAAKVVLPVAAGIFAPKLAGLFGGDSGSAQSFPVSAGDVESRGLNDPPPAAQPQTGFDWKGAIQTAAPLVLGGMNMYGQQQTNAANAQQAQKQMDFQQEMSSTAYQRGTADMKAAGINPVMAYSQGGASSPGGAQAQMGNEIGEGANSAFSAMQTMQALQQTAATTANINAQTNLTNKQADTEVQRRLDLMEQIPGHRISQGYTSSRTGGQDINNQLDKIRTFLAAETYSDQVRQAAANAKNSEAQINLTKANTSSTLAGVGEKAARSEAVQSLSSPIISGLDTISSVKQWLSKQMQDYDVGGKLYDFNEWYTSKPKKMYGAK